MQINHFLLNLDILKFLIFNFLLITVFTGEIFSQKKLILQPDAQKGKDAVVWYISRKDTKHGNVNERNFGTDKDFKAMAWSFDGNIGEKRSLIEFDLSQLPENAYITSAYLSLFANRESGDAGKKGHEYIYVNSNECLLQRIIEPWNENHVTWNTQPKITHENEILIHKSEYPYQDYENIDITQLVRDELKNPKESFGFGMSVKEAKRYNCLIFASSDNPNPELHPKIVVNYTTGKSKNSHLNKKRSDKYNVIIYNEKGEEIKRVKGVLFDKLTGFESGTYHFNLMKNNQIISAGKFIIY